jgi:NADPH-dependent 2,4-dienoyl-CoA reductase/sulfur reductase-like enzyme
VTVDARTKQVTDDQGTVYSFEKLLLATGGTPRRLPLGSDHIIYYRSLDDYQRLRALTARGQQFAIIGGGFIGSEIAAALAMNGKKVTMLFPEAGIGARIFPPDLGHFLNEFYHEKDVEVLSGEQVSDLAVTEGRTILKTRSGREVTVDGVVAGIGIQPNDALAEAIGLQVDNGILVDESLRTQHEAIYAAGDVANFYNPALRTRLRVEHEDNANTMGRAAGRAMAGEASPYHHLPFFYSDLFDLGYEAVGDVDARLETVVDWEEPYRKGVVYYLRNSRVRGVLLWNTLGQVDAARALIGEPGPFRPSDLKGRLPVS